MAKTGTWFKKLRDKQRKHSSVTKLGKHSALMARPPAKSSTYSAKAISYNEHAKAIMEGHNPGPANTFRGDGLVDDSLQALKVPKTNQERAAADKRKSIASESKETFRPRAFGSRKYGTQVSGSYLAR